MSETPLQAAIRALAAELFIEPAVIDGSAHPYACRCNTCCEWWVLMGPDPDSGKHGPFTDDEIAQAKERLNR